MLSGGEIIIILVVALVVFGPQRLPELARAIGKVMHELNRAMQDVKTNIEVESEQPIKETKDEANTLPDKREMTEDRADSKNKGADTEISSWQQKGHD